MGGDEEEESIPADWTTEEDILALYFMGTTLYENSTWVYGIRFEDTETTYKGKNWNDTYLGDNEFENNYTFAAPSLNIKYDISDDMVLRLNVENLSDELYFPHSHSTHQASVGEPLNARVSLSKRF